MPLRTVIVKIRYRRQVIDERPVSLDTKDDDAIRSTLLASLDRLGIDPTPDHSISVYRRGELLKKLHAA